MHIKIFIVQYRQKAVHTYSTFYWFFRHIDVLRLFPLGEPCKPRKKAVPQPTAVLCAPVVFLGVTIQIPLIDKHSGN